MHTRRMHSGIGGLSTAERVDAALSAARSGVAFAELRTAFGDEAAHVADGAASLFGLTRGARPETSFVAHLESRLAVELDARPRPARGQGLVAEWALAAGSPVLAVAAAAVIAVTAFLSSGGPAAVPRQTPTALAATHTATTEVSSLAPPPARATADVAGIGTGGRLHAAVSSAHPAPLPEPTLDG